MTAGVFSADEWIDRLARVLPGLAEAQEPYLQEYYRQNPRVHVVCGGPDGDPPAFPLDDLQALVGFGVVIAADFTDVTRVDRTRRFRVGLLEDDLAEGEWQRQSPQTAT